LNQLRKRLTYANVMSSIAVFLVIGGGAAFAALGKNTVGTPQLKKNAVKAGKIGPEAVKAGKLAKNAVTTNRLRDNIVTSAKIVGGSILTDKIANDAVTGDKVDESSLGTVPKAADAEKLGGLLPAGYQTRVRWALVNSAANGNKGEILAQSGGVSVAAGLAGFSYLDWGESIANKALSVSIAQITEGFITVTPCGGASAPAGTTCVPAGTNDANHTIVRMDTAALAAANQIYFISVTG
jgi:hypothetical protein